MDISMQNKQKLKLNVRFEGIEMVIRDATKSGAQTSSHVNLPGDWTGRKVACYLLKEIVEDADERTATP